MADKLPSRPTLDIRDALNELLRRNDRTQDKEVGEMYLGSAIFIARLKRPQVLEGSWENLDRTVDLFDLIDAHQRGDGSLPSRGSHRPGDRPNRSDSQV